LDNNLVGFQVGGEGEFCLTPGLTLDFGTKFGIYGNRIQHFSQIGGAAGVATINNGPNLGRQFRVDNSKNDVSFLAELNLGAEYCLTDCWTLTGGYRAVAVTGVALPTNQIYPDLRGIQDVELIASNGSLILHGAYFGAEYNY
jgi:opacity protein-like surface antigen